MASENNKVEEFLRGQALKGPIFGQASFKCPTCSAFSQQNWHQAIARTEYSAVAGRADDAVRFADYGTAPGVMYKVQGVYFTVCQACREISIWRGGRCVFPKVKGTVPSPATDMPEDVRDDYNEAAEVLEVSPRASAALLRLAVEKLCRSLGKSGSIDKMIGDLVKDGLPKRIQQALDTVRVIGNEAVHPGSLDLKDDRKTASTLFELVDFIVDRMITQERKIEEMYHGLPANKLLGIEQRDGQKN